MVKKNLETPLCSPSRSDVPSCLASDKQSKSLTVKGAKSQKVPPATYVRRVEKRRKDRIQVDLRERLEQ